MRVIAKNKRQEISDTVQSSNEGIKQSAPTPAASTSTAQLGADLLTSGTKVDAEGVSPPQPLSKNGY